MRSRSWISATRKRQVRLRVRTPQIAGEGIALGRWIVSARCSPAAFCQPPLGTANAPAERHHLTFGEDIVEGHLQALGARR